MSIAYYEITDNVESPMFINIIIRLNCKFMYTHPANSFCYRAIYRCN